MPKKVISIIIIVFGLFGGFFVIEDRYAKCSQIKEYKVETEEKLEAHYLKTAQTLDSVLLEYKITNEKTGKRELDNQIKSQQRWIMQYPNDEGAKGELEDLRERRRQTEDRLHQLENQR